jgi:hypothetical protein
MTAKKAPKSTPKQKSLPGMEDRKIEELHAAAEDYAEVRDKRMDLLDEEIEMKASLGKLMHKHGLTKYSHHGLVVMLVPGEENVKVKVKKDKEGKED